MVYNQLTTIENQETALLIDKSWFYKPWSNRDLKLQLDQRNLSF